MPLYAIPHAAKTRLGSLINGITSDDDLALIGPANVAQLLLKGFWKQPHRVGGPFDRAFSGLIKMLPDKEVGERMWELWDDGCDPGDEYDVEFQELVASFAPTIPFLPRLRPKKYAASETVMWVQAQKKLTERDIEELDFHEHHLPWHNVMQRQELEHFRSATNRRLLTIFYLNGGGDPVQFEDFARKVKEGSVAPSIP